MEGDDPESGLLEDTHMKDVVDFGGCTNSAYQIDCDQVTTSGGTERRKNSIFLVCKQISNEALDVIIARMPLGFISTQMEVCLKRTFTEANRRRMRMLLLNAEHRA